MRGRFVTLEGIDGAGKSSHLQWIARFLRARGHRVKVTREPGGTPLGERLRALVLASPQRLDAETEALLMFAARREHLARVIEPALKRGIWVLCDRFTDATYAYQSGGTGVGWEKIRYLEKWVHPDLQPDLTILFDVAPATGRKRTGRKGKADRFERERDAFFGRVRRAYLRRAAAHPRRIRVLNANKGLPEVKKELEKILLSFC
ncbi:MAG TPA: dTMP kinase [Burkholderiales bacterium]|nr:dTMP kinase [Burkholderiales bacterium]